MRSQQVVQLLLGATGLAGHAVAVPVVDDVSASPSGNGGSEIDLLTTSSGELERRGSQGAFFLLINATPWTLSKAGAHSYQMNEWDFPETIEPGELASLVVCLAHTNVLRKGTSTRIYIEARGRGDDGGESSYKIDAMNPDSPPIFEFQYRGKLENENGPIVQVHFSSLEMLNNPAGSTLRLEWRKDNNLPFVIASSEEDPSNPSIQPMVVSSNPPEDWMHATYNRISCLSLRELSMPGTHDSGMSEFNGGSFLGNPGNSKTQEIGVGDQLKYGARWFDIRPVITGGKWATGHYSFGAGNWHGGNGQFIDAIVDQINGFTASNKELLIVKLSHGYNSDDFKGDEDNHLTQDEWGRLMRKLLALEHRVTGRGGEGDLSKLSVSDLINDRAAVIIVVDDVVDTHGNGVDVSEFADEGFFRPNQLPLYDNYADEKNQDKMIEDQLEKLKAQRPSPDSGMFLLSWTKTQFEKNVVDNAKHANRALMEKLWPAMSRDTYPNIINIDAYPRNRDVAALAMAINYHFARRC